MDLDNLAQNNIYCEGWNFKQAKDKDSLFVTYDENSKVDIFKYKILWIMHIMFWDSAQKLVLVLLILEATKYYPLIHKIYIKLWDSKKNNWNII